MLDHCSFVRQAFDCTCTRTYVQPNIRHDLIDDALCELVWFVCLPCVLFPLSGSSLDDTLMQLRAIYAQHLNIAFLVMFGLLVTNRATLYSYIKVCRHDRVHSSEYSCIQNTHVFRKLNSGLFCIEYFVLRHFRFVPVPAKTKTHHYFPSTTAEKTRKS
jgi:hypothetical protein